MTIANELQFRRGQLTVGESAIRILPVPGAALPTLRRRNVRYGYWLAYRAKAA